MKLGAARFRRGEEVCVLISPAVWDRALVLICTCSHNGRDHDGGILRGRDSQQVVQFLGDEWFILWEALGDQKKEERDGKLRLLLDAKLEFGGELTDEHIAKYAPRKAPKLKPAPDSNLFTPVTQPPPAAIEAAHAPTARELLLARLRGQNK